MLKKNKHGFTLIEIIVVIVILAVLMAVAVPTVLKYIDSAKEAPALTECYAYVTASQKRVIDKYAQNKSDNIYLNDDDKIWIDDFVNVDNGEIQGNISVKNNEVIKLLYKASNGLYVLFDKSKNPEYSIVSQDEISNSIIYELNNMVDEYSDSIKELFENKEIKKSESRENVIAKLFEKSESIKVNSTLKDKTNSKNDLYWKPYYLGSTENPSVILFANSSQKDHGGWKANLVCVNGRIYQCDTNIASYYDMSLTKLEQTIQSQPDIYKLVELD